MVSLPLKRESMVSLPHKRESMVLLPHKRQSRSQKSLDKTGLLLAQE